VQDNNYVKPTAYRTLSMASGAKITVNGAMSLAGSIQTNTPMPGTPRGPVGFVRMQEDSNITVNNGGALYVWGFITGAGSVTVESGGTVFEDFQVTDFRGGDNTSKIVSNVDKYHMFPFNQYYIQNIEVPMTLKAGAVENGYMAVYVSLVGIQGSDVPFIGPNGMFYVTDGYIIKDYDEATDRLVIDVYGTIEMKNLTVSMKLGILGTTTINSKDYDLPVNSNISVHIHDGSTVNITQDISLLPGTELILNQGATANLAQNRIIIYDKDELRDLSNMNRILKGEVETNIQDDSLVPERIKLFSENSYWNDISNEGETLRMLYYFGLYQLWINGQYDGVKGDDGTISLKAFDTITVGEACAILYK